MDSPFFSFKLILFFVLLLFSAFFSSSESSLFSLGRFRIRRLKNIGLKQYNAAKNLIDHPTRLISTLLIGNEMVNAAIGVVGSSLVYELFEGKIDNPKWLPVIAIASVLPFLILFGEIVPKTLGLKFSERVAALNAIPLDLFSTLIRPIRGLVSVFPEVLLKLLGNKKEKGDSVSEDVFRSMVDVSTKEGVLDSHERELIHNVFLLDDVLVETIMTPKNHMSFLVDTQTVGQVLDKFLTEHYSRYPVLNVEQKWVVGVLYVKDLLSVDPSKYNEPLSSYLRKPLIVEPTDHAMKLFTDFKNHKTHFATVVKNATQEILGVVTLENVLERIFGDIRDERDRAGDR